MKRLTLKKLSQYLRGELIRIDLGVIFLYFLVLSCFLFSYIRNWTSAKRYQALHQELEQVRKVCKEVSKAEGEK